MQGNHYCSGTHRQNKRGRGIYSEALRPMHFARDQPRGERVSILRELRDLFYQVPHRLHSFVGQEVGFVRQSLYLTWCAWKQISSYRCGDALVVKLCHGQERLPTAYCYKCQDQSHSKALIRPYFR